MFMITYHIVVVHHTWMRPDCHSSSPARSQITGSFFSPFSLTPDAAIMWILLLPEVEVFPSEESRLENPPVSASIFSPFLFILTFFSSEGVIKAVFSKSFPLFFSFCHQHPQSQSFAWKASCVSAAQQEAEPLDLFILSVASLLAVLWHLIYNLQFTEENPARTLLLTFTMIHDSPSNLFPNLGGRLAGKKLTFHNAYIQSDYSCPDFALCQQSFHLHKKIPTTCFCYAVKLRSQLS